MNPQPGDVIFYVADSKNLIARLQRLTGQAGSSGLEFSHVAMVSNDPDLIIEMTFPRPRFRYFADDTRNKLILRPSCAPTIKQRAIQWMYLHVDSFYSLPQMVLGSLGLCRATRICSGWVNTAYSEAGYPLADLQALVSPDELYASLVLKQAA